MARNLRFLVLLVAAAVQLSSVPSLAGPTLTDEQLSFVTWGESRFIAAGLELPEVTYEFHDDTEACGWHRGLYNPNTQVVAICNMNQETLIHELAHAWAEYNLSDSEKAAFMDRRGLPTWSSHDYSWAERGTEQVAEIIAWGLAPESKLVRWIKDGGERVTFLLLTIPDSEPQQLFDEYQRLTGSEPVYRHADEWSSAEVPASSPEAARAGAQSEG